MKGDAVDAENKVQYKRDGDDPLFSGGKTQLAVV